MSDKKDNKNKDKQQEDYKTKNCLTCAHQLDDAHCERIECQEFSGWTPARNV
jgi:hypothetical protein